MSDMTPKTELTLTGKRVNEILAAANVTLKTVAKKVGVTPSQLKSAAEHGAHGELALKLAEFEDTLPKANELKGGKVVPSKGSSSEQKEKEGTPAPRERKPRAKKSAAPAEGATPPPADPEPSTPLKDGSPLWFAQEIKGSHFNERAEGLVKGTDWVEAYVPLPMDLHQRIQKACKVLGVSLKDFRTFAFIRVISEIENAEA